MAYRRHPRWTLLRALIVASIAVALVVGLGAWVVAIQRPMPPRTLVMATGPVGGAYFDFGPRYREVLARAGIELRLLPTAGAVENLERLRDPRSGVSAAFVQCGTTTAQDSPDLVSLGTVFYEPLWLFYRGTPRGGGLAWLSGKRLSIGQDGSGTRALVVRLLELNGLDPRGPEMLSLPPEQASEKLLRGEIDAAAILTSWDSPVVRKLVATPEVGLASFPRADAYVALLPYLNKRILPTGVGDMAANLPPQDVELLSPKASLVVRRDLHPALQYLLLEAASQIHAAPGMFQKAGEFPAPEAIDLPLGDEARQFYKTGRPWLQRHLPFWLAVLIERLLVVLIPVVGLLYPVMRFLPSLYVYRQERRIYALYGELKFLESELDRAGPGHQAGDLLEQLEVLEGRANRLRVPESFAAPLYTLRHHITLVRQRLERHTSLALKPPAAAPLP